MSELAALLAAPELPDDEDDEDDEDFAAGEEDEDDDDDFAPGDGDEGEEGGQEDAGGTEMGDEGEEGMDEEGEEDADEEDESGFGGSTRTPLHAAASRGDSEQLQQLLEEGAANGRIVLAAGGERALPFALPFEINALDRNGQTPLQAALIGAGTALSVLAAGSDDAWAPKTAANVELVLREPLSSPLASFLQGAALDGGAESLCESYCKCVQLLLAASASPAPTYFGRSTLHIAAALGALPPCLSFAASATRQLVGAGASLVAADGDGATPLHYAASCDTGLPPHPRETVLTNLLSADAAVVAEALRRTDRLGRTPLHTALLLADESGRQAALQLVEAGAPLEPADHEGVTPLHLAAAAGLSEIVKLLLERAPTAGAALDSWGRSAAELAAACGRGECVALLAKTAAVTPSGSQPPPLEPEINAAPLHTLLLSHPACLLHAAAVGPLLDSLSASQQQMLFGQPECAERLRCMLGPYGTLRARRFSKLLWRAAPKAHVADVLRVHEAAYVQALQAQCAGLARRAALAPQVPQVGKVDPDTEVNQHSLDAALLGAGAVVEAVRAVCGARREARNAFCAVRPPGHHAGPRGAVGGQTAGFCLLSAAAIGAAYALACERERVKRVAIVDFDVHHGNGTEACVKNVVASEHTEHFTTSGGTLSLARTEFKPWLSHADSRNVFFGSIHGFGAEDKAEEPEEQEAPPDPDACFYPGTGGPGTDCRAPTVLNAPMPLQAPSKPWRYQMTKHLLMPLKAFAPDLIIISAGFDAHAHDPLQAGALHDVDFEWMSAQLVAIAESTCDGRLVSTLEGGYRISGGPLSSLGRATAAHVGALMQPALVARPWAESEALERLQQTLDAEARWHEAHAARREAAREAARQAVREEAAARQSLAEAPTDSAEAAAASASEKRLAAAKAAMEAEAELGGGPSRRSKRSRSEVDYVALEAKMKEEETEKPAE